jgi:hypothetical protein
VAAADGGHLEVIGRVDRDLVAADRAAEDDAQWVDDVVDHRRGEAPPPA